MVVGIVAVVCAFVPVVGELVAVPAAVAAIVLGSVELWRVDRGTSEDLGAGVVGVSLGLLALMVVALVFVATSDVVS